MAYTGRCHCGAIHYQLEEQPNDVSVCHCADCRRNAGAPMVVWAGFPETALALTKGTPKTFNSSATAIRSFCDTCGTGLFYRNEKLLPGIVEVQSSTLDDPDALPPTVQIQMAERLGWVERLHEMPGYDRFPE